MALAQARFYSFFRRLTGSKMFANLANLFSSTIFAQSALAISTPILTRYYAPEAFGYLSLVIASYGILVPLATLKYDQAVLLSKSQHSARCIGSLVMTIASLMSPLVFICLLACLYLFNASLSPIILVLPLAIWLGSANTLLQCWSARISCYQYYSKGIVLGVLVNVGFSLISAIWYGASNGNLCIAFLMGLLSSCIYAAAKFKRWPYKYPFGLKASRSKALLKAYSRFPAFVLPSVILTGMSVNFLPVVLSHFYSLDQIGLFAISNRLLLLPTAILGGVIAEVVRSKVASVILIKGPLVRVFKITFLPILFTALVLYFLAYALSPALITAFSSEKYYASIPILHALTLSSFAIFVSTPFTCLLPLLKTPKISLYVQSSILILPLCLVLALASVRTEFTLILYGYSVAMLLISIVAMCVVCRQLYHHDKAQAACYAKS